MATYYEILGVPEDVDADLLDDAMRAQQKIHHPDRGGSVEMSALINVAYDILSNPLDRAAYDRTLREDRTHGSPGTGSSGRTESTTSPSPDPWDDWDTYATPSESKPSARQSAPPPGSPTHWLHGPMGGFQRRLGNVITVLLAASAFIVAAGVREQVGSSDGIDATDRTSIVSGLVLVGGFLVVGLSVQGISWLAHRSRQARTPKFPRGRYASGGIVFVGIAAIIAGLMGMATLPQLGADGSFPAAASAEGLGDGTTPSTDPQAAPEEIPGQTFPAGTCRTHRSPDGRLLPDADCSPGTVSDAATADALCASQYQPARPSDASIVQARADVARGYARAGTKGNPSKVAFVVPIRLGGTWNLQNMWPRGALVAPSTVDRVLAALCAPGSTLTLTEVQTAAVGNDLVGLLAP